jgi:DNA-binding MarR family transcriptional regulator
VPSHERASPCNTTTVARPRQLHICYYLAMANPESVLVVALEEMVLGLLTPVELRGLRSGAELDLSLAQARALFLVNVSPYPLPIHTIGREVGVSVATAGRHVDRLVGLGLVSRDESPSDRRIKLVAPTEHGRRMIADQLELRRSAIRRFVELLPEPQRADLETATRAALETGVLSAIHDVADGDTLLDVPESLPTRENA